MNTEVAQLTLPTRSPILVTKWGNFFLLKFQEEEIEAEIARQEKEIAREEEAERVKQEEERE